MTSLESPALQTKSPRWQHRRAPLRKQSSLHSDTSERRDLLESGEGFLADGRKVVESGTSLRGWREALQRGRIQRLIVLMQSSEPGTIPDAGMLGTLIDLVGCIIIHVHVAATCTCM